MAIVVDKLLTVLGFKIDAGDLEKYRKLGRDARKEVGGLLGKAAGAGAGALDMLGSVGKGAMSALAVAGGVVTATIGAGVLVMNQFAGVVGGAVSAAVSTVTGLLERAAGATKRFVGEVFNANVEFENLFTRLKTLTGAKAPGIFKELEKFAAETPFQLNEIIDAYIRLSGLGFDMSKQNRKALGDLAAASGKTFGDMAEIMSSANRGSAQMLDNLLGVTATVKGGKFTVSAKKFGIDERTFKVGDQKALMKFLTDLGKAKGIEGGMARLSKTLGGLLSTLKDNVAAFYREVGQAGFNKAVKKLFETINMGAPQTSALAQSIGRLLGKIVTFGRKTFEAFRFDKALLTLEVALNKLGLNFDKLGESNGPTKLARLLEWPFRLLDDFMLILEGRGAETSLKRFFDQFDDKSTPIGRLAAQVRKFLDLTYEMIAVPSEGPSFLDQVAQFTGEETLKVLETFLSIVNKLIEKREQIAALLTLVMKTTSALTELLTRAREMGIGKQKPGGIPGVNAPVGPPGSGLTMEKAVDFGERVSRGADRFSEEGLGAIPAKLKENAISAIASMFRGLLPSNLSAERAAGARQPGAGPSSTTNTTTNTTSTNNTVNVGTINVKSTDEISGAVGGLATATG